MFTRTFLFCIYFDLLSHTVTLEIKTRSPKHIQLLVMCQYHAHVHTSPSATTRHAFLHFKALILASTPLNDLEK